MPKNVQRKYNKEVGTIEKLIQKMWEKLNKNKTSVKSTSSP